MVGSGGAEPVTLGRLNGSGVLELWSVDEHKFRVQSCMIKIESEVRLCLEEVLLELFGLNSGCSR